MTSREAASSLAEDGPEQSRRPNEIRSARFTPAVEFIQGNRFRMRVMEQMDEAMSNLDLFIGSDLRLTNRTGHPVLSIPVVSSTAHQRGSTSPASSSANRKSCCWRTRSRRPPIITCGIRRCRNGEPL